jgi:hypothetical protein
MRDCWRCCLDQSTAQTEIAEQQGAGLPHPYASGIFSVTHHDDSSTYTAQLNFHREQRVRYFVQWRAYVVACGNLSWIKGVKEAERSLRFDALS